MRPLAPAVHHVAAVELGRRHAHRLQVADRRPEGAIVGEVIRNPDERDERHRPDQRCGEPRPDDRSAAQDQDDGQGQDRQRVAVPLEPQDRDEREVSDHLQHQIDPRGVQGPRRARDQTGCRPERDHGHHPRPPASGRRLDVVGQERLGVAELAQRPRLSPRRQRRRVVGTGRQLRRHHRAQHYQCRDRDLPSARAEAPHRKRQQREPERPGEERHGRERHAGQRPEGRLPQGSEAVGRRVEDLGEVADRLDVVLGPPRDQREEGQGDRRPDKPQATTTPSVRQQRYCHRDRQDDSHDPNADRAARREDRRAEPAVASQARRAEEREGRPEARDHQGNVSHEGKRQHEIDRTGAETRGAEERVAGAHVLVTEHEVHRPQPGERRDPRGDPERREGEAER